jgi:hypothetical protein
VVAPRVAKGYSFLADLFVAAGARFAVPDFAPLQDVGQLVPDGADRPGRRNRWADWQKLW